MKHEHPFSVLRLGNGLLAHSLSISFLFLFFYSYICNILFSSLCIIDIYGFSGAWTLFTAGTYLTGTDDEHLRSILRFQFSSLITRVVYYVFSHVVDYVAHRYFDTYLSCISTIYFLLVLYTPLTLSLSISISYSLSFYFPTLPPIQYIFIVVFFCICANE